MPDPNPPTPRLTILEPDPDGIDDLETEESLDPTESSRTVLLTGACTPLGRSLRTAWAGRFNLVPIDRDPTEADPEVESADLTTWDDDWADLFEEVDIAVHLAAEPTPDARQGPIAVGPGFDAAAHVFLAAAASGVDRLIFAAPRPAEPDRPHPDVQAADRLGRALASGYGIDFAALDLEPGAVDRPASPEILARFEAAIETAGDPDPTA